jgi:hypothetical protein
MARCSFSALCGVLAAFLTVLAFLASPATADIFDPFRRFTLTQRLRDFGEGHDFANFSDSVHAHGRYVAVGSASAVGFRGACRIYYDAGDGYNLTTTLTDPDGQLGDGFGKQVLLFDRGGVPHVAVAAVNKNDDGAVLVFRRVHDAYWPLQETLEQPEGTGAYATNFGRHLFYDGSSVIVSAESRYKHSKRFVISSRNVKGTRYFEESTGSSPIPGDPIFAFRAKDGRRNTTRLTLLQTIRGADYTFDFGASVALGDDRRTLAVGAFSRREARYGYGTDGDLIVEGIKLLDGTAEYNFNNVEIMPGGVLTTDNYETLRGQGGALRLRIQGRLKIHPGGTINMTAHGYKGAETMYTATRRANGEGPGGGVTATSLYTGELSCSYDDSGVSVLSSDTYGSKTARNGSSSMAFAEANGGGGGYGTHGVGGIATQCGDSGAGGTVYGEPLLDTVYLGSGGGAGHPWKIGSGGAGGAGGGIIVITARSVVNEGIIVSDGGRGSDGGFYSGGGGGGSGGSVFISGIFLENYGYIYARGGDGGTRSTNSGSEGDPKVHGGKGGAGRVRLEFLTTASSGIVVPHPLNGTQYDGDVWLYHRNLATDLYEAVSVMPRLPGMKFIGHSVAVFKNLLAVASDDRSSANPAQSVFLVDYTSIKNSSSPIYLHREISRITPEDLQFGWRLAMYNDTLVIGAAGQNDLARGVVYLLSGHNLFAGTTELHTIHSKRSTVGDYFGTTWFYQYPVLFVSDPLQQDDLLTDPDGRLSQGNIQVWKHIRNISAAHSSVTCRWPSATVNTTVLCTIHTVDSFGSPAGDVHDLGLFTYPHGIRFLHPGRYEFNVTAQGSGPMEVYVIHKGSKLPGTTITVTPGVLAHLANVSCLPLNPVAGDPVTCTITTFNHAGEESAVPYFRALVYHTNDVTLSPNHEDKETQYGNFRTPPSSFVPTFVEDTDFPTVEPAVEFERYGKYSFTFTTWRPGTTAAFVMYGNKALAFPNPVLVDAAEPTLSAADSSIKCPTIAAPNRTVVCTLYLRSAGGVPTDREELGANFTTATSFLHATLNGVPLEVTTLWAQEGRVSVLIYPQIEGTLVFDGELNSVAIPMTPASGVTVSTRYTTTCTRMSSVMMSFTIMNQHAMGRSDDSVYGIAAADAAYLSGTGMCDNGRV